MRRVLTLLILAFCHSVAYTESGVSGVPGFAVVPPGPVAEGARVELRLGVRNPANEPMPVRATFYLDTESPEAAIGDQEIVVPGRESGLVHVWLDTSHLAGTHVLRYILNDANGESRGAWPLEVHSASTRALPFLQGMWVEPLAVLQGAADPSPETLRQVVRDSVLAMHGLGVRVIVIAYVEYFGQFFYPSRLSFLDADVQRVSAGADCSFDLVGTLLSEADALGMHVLLGLGRSGDTQLLWEFDAPDWEVRKDGAVEIARNVASELWERYGHHPSYYGWYLSHEMADLARAGAYYDPVARYCHALAPEKPVMVAPAGTPVITPALLAASAVDIFAYQDAVGAGYVPYEYTYKPERRIAMLEAIYATYRDWHVDSGKHFWSDLEVWEMDGSQGYAGAYPATMDRIRQQITVESRQAELLTGYAWHGYLQSPGAAAERPIERARRLYADYASYVQGLSRGVR